eukprot:COSAG06_NODE_12892_length_1315_cov_1.178454_1_plen_296_part_00
MHTPPTNFKGKILPDRVVDDGLNGPMKGAIVQVKPNITGPTTPVRILMTRCTQHPPNMSREEAAEANKLSDMSGNDLYDNTAVFNYETAQVDVVLAEATVGSLLSLGALLTKARAALGKKRTEKGAAEALEALATTLVRFTGLQMPEAVDALKIITVIGSAYQKAYARVEKGTAGEGKESDTGSVLAVTGTKLTEAELKNLSMLITTAAGSIDDDDEMADHIEHSTQDILATLLGIKGFSPEYQLDVPQEERNEHVGKLDTLLLLLDPSKQSELDQSSLAAAIKQLVSAADWEWI